MPAFGMEDFGDDFENYYGFENYYAILGVDTRADAAKLTSAWITAAVVFHPESIGDRANHRELLPRAEARYRLLALSYNVLMNSANRAVYDKVYDAEPHIPSTIEAEMDKSAMADLDTDARFAPLLPSMWEHYMAVTRHGAQRLAGWFNSFVESSGTTPVPRLRKEDAWIIDRIISGSRLVDGVANEILAAIVRLKDAEVEKERMFGVIDSPLNLIGAILRRNGLPRHWDIPVRASLITPAMKLANREVPVLPLLFPAEFDEFSQSNNFIRPLDLEDVADLAFDCPHYVQVKNKVPGKFFSSVRGWFRKSSAPEAISKSPPADECGSSEKMIHGGNVPWGELPPNFIPCIAVGDIPPTLNLRGQLVQESGPSAQTLRRSGISITDLPNRSKLDILTDAIPSRATAIVYHCPSPARSPVVIPPAEPVTPTANTRYSQHHGFLPISGMPATHDNPSLAPDELSDEESYGTLPPPSSLRRRKAVKLGLRLRLSRKTREETLDTTHYRLVSASLPCVHDSSTTPKPTRLTSGQKADMPTSLRIPSHAHERDMEVQLHVGSTTIGHKPAAATQQISFTRRSRPAIPKEYMLLGSAAPDFITEMAVQWATRTPGAVVPAFRVIDKTELPAGTYCRGWGVYFHDVVVWEAWNGAEKRKKFFVRRPVPPELAAQLKIALESERDASDPKGWTSVRVGFFTRRTRDIPSGDQVTVEWSRGPWGIRMLAEYLKKGWEEDESDFESEGSSGEEQDGCGLNTRIVAPAFKWKGMQTPVQGTQGWVGKILGRVKKNEKNEKNETIGVSQSHGEPPTIRSTFRNRKKNDKPKQKGVSKARRELKDAAAGLKQVPSVPRAESVPHLRPKSHPFLTPGPEMDPHFCRDSQSTKLLRNTFLHTPNVDIWESSSFSTHPQTRSNPIARNQNRYAFVLEARRRSLGRAQRGSLDKIPEDGEAEPPTPAEPLTPTDDPRSPLIAYSASLWGPRVPPRASVLQDDDANHAPVTPERMSWHTATFGTWSPRQWAASTASTPPSSRSSRSTATNTSSSPGSRTPTPRSRHFVARTPPLSSRSRFAISPSGTLGTLGDIPENVTPNSPSQATEGTPAASRSAHSPPYGPFWSHRGQSDTESQSKGSTGSGSASEPEPAEFLTYSRVLFSSTPISFRRGRIGQFMSGEDEEVAGGRFREGPLTCTLGSDSDSPTARNATSLRHPTSSGTDRRHNMPPT